MPLSESHIVRYSRQILLGPVGGAGQEHLLRSSVEMQGVGSAFAVAAAYLCGGGTTVVWPNRPVVADEVGFFRSAASVGARAEAPDYPQPEAILPWMHRGQLSGPRQPVAGAGPWVTIGAHRDRAVVVYGSSRGCLACFQATREPLSPAPTDVRSALLGALAALAFQRMVLGLGEGVGAASVAPSGAIDPWPLTLCKNHSKAHG